eukprot:874516-Prorocentrum_minimum.AAC.1
MFFTKRVAVVAAATRAPRRRGRTRGRRGRRCARRSPAPPTLEPTPVREANQKSMTQTRSSEVNRFIERVLEPMYSSTTQSVKRRPGRQKTNGAPSEVIYLIFI